MPPHRLAVGTFICIVLRRLNSCDCENDMKISVVIDITDWLDPHLVADNFEF